MTRLRPACLLLAAALLAGTQACRSSLPPELASQPASEALAAQGTRAELEAWLGHAPHLCLPLDAASEACEWRLTQDALRHEELAGHMGVRDQIGVLCELPTDSRRREADACTLHQRLTNRDRMGNPGMGRQNRTQSRAQAIQDRNDEARRQIDGATTLLAMSRTLGHLPEGCVAEAGERRCDWLLSNQSAGHGTVARLTGASMQRKFWYRCRFPEDGSPRRPDSCQLMEDMR